MGLPELKTPVQTNSGSSESGPSGPTRIGGRGHAAVLDSSDPNRQIHMQQGDHLKQARHQLGDSSAPRGVNLYESDCAAQRCGVRRHPHVGDRYSVHPFGEDISMTYYVKPKQLNIFYLCCALHFVSV